MEGNPMTTAHTRRALCVIAAFAGGPAVAGGLTEPEPAPVIQPAPVVTAPAFNWTGGFAGLQFGALNSSIDSNVGFFEDDYEFGKNVDGSVIGIYGGYDWQQTGSPWVFGFDAEYNWVDADDDASVLVGVLGRDEEIESTTQATIDATAALRGRVGYTYERALFYGTAGLSYIDYEIENEINGDSDNTSADNWGWTLGAGVEYAFTDQISGRIDYRYSDYDGDDGSWYEGDSDYDIDLETSEIRLGIAYRF
jgi:outer membrane immunogenic protein